MYEPYGARHNGHEERRYSPIGPEPHRFWGFTFSGSVRLEELVRFYGLRVDRLEPGLTLNRFLERVCNERLRPGHRAVVGGAELRVLEMSNGAVQRVGLELRPTRLRRPPYHRRFSPRGKVANPGVLPSYKVA